MNQSAHTHTLGKRKPGLAIHSTQEKLQTAEETKQNFVAVRGLFP